jgi:hypothetical protein
MHHAALLLLADGRLPAGGYAHSGGLEPAIQAGQVRDLDDVAAFIGGRLDTVGQMAATFAAAACRAAQISDGARLDYLEQPWTPGPRRLRSGPPRVSSDGSSCVPSPGCDPIPAMPFWAGSRTNR